MLSSKNCTRLAGSVRSKKSSTQLCFSPTPRSPRVKYGTWTAARARANGDGEQHRCKKGRAHRLRWCSPWICRWQRNPGARGQGRVTPTIQHTILQTTFLVMRNFSMAFFTDFGVRGYVGLLDWYTVSIAIFASVILAAHGATYLTLKTEGPVHDRSATGAKYLWAASVPLFVGISVESWGVVRGDLIVHAVRNPFCWLGVLIVAVSIIVLVSGISAHRETRAFVGSNALLAGLLVTGATAIYPVMLYSTLAPENSLTAYAVAASRD